MSSLTLAIDEDLKERIDEHPEINWSHVARESIESKLDDLELMDRLADGIDLSEEDIDAIAEDINRRATERAMADLAERDGDTESDSEPERAGAQ
jgi:CBS-domain-containing membrane protein